MNLGHTTAPDRCPRCLRTRNEAVADHLRLGEGCDCPDCPFRNEIQRALEEQARKPKITFGPVRKPTFTFSEHKENRVRILFRKINDAIDNIF